MQGLTPTLFAFAAVPVQRPPTVTVVQAPSDGAKVDKCHNVSTIILFHVIISTSHAAGYFFATKSRLFPKLARVTTSEKTGRRRLFVKVSYGLQQIYCV